ncbi:MAG: hypothetical protein IH840_03995 [Candidatus Heimdallarchaeota archaeon]|nr:hypothetical protein [Candidatus Heimdallarchaeota archaeon]
MVDNNNDGFYETHELIGSETTILLDLKELIFIYDPDILQIPHGDGMTLPYLANRARKNQITEKFWLGRLEIAMKPRKRAPPQQFVTYGNIVIKEQVYYLPGRIHLDYDNSFLLYESDISGLIELSRMSSVPLERASRTSIGTILTGIELVINQDKKYRTLLPASQPNEETFKSSATLLSADNGGLTYEGHPGVHDRVWALDYTSMFPFIMLNNNIGSETILCGHEECLNVNVVPDIGYHICTKVTSVVKRTLELILGKRLLTKQLKQMDELSEELTTKYKRIDSAYKWVLVCAFGYLGFRSTRFGTIEAHQAVNAYSRNILRRSKEISRDFGFETVRGIVDSIFIRAKNIRDDTNEKVIEIQRTLTKEIGIPIDIEGKYNWVVFPHVRDFAEVAALNRYFGYYAHGEFKIRGIRSRQASVTELEVKFQAEVLEILKPAMSAQDFLELIPLTYKLLRKYRRMIVDEEVDILDLVFKIKSHVGAGNYQSKTVQALTVQQYSLAGYDIKAGQNMNYVVMDDRLRTAKRIMIEPQLKRELQFDPGKRIGYDKNYYVKVLKKALLEMVEAPQRQYFGRLLYDIEGEEQSLDQIFEIGNQSKDLELLSAPIDKSDQSIKIAKYPEGDYRSNKPVSLAEQHDYIEDAKRKKRKKKKAIEEYWEVDEEVETDQKVPSKNSMKKNGSKKTVRLLDSFFD